MFHLDELEHVGNPSKVKLPDGSLIFTLIAEDVPVTYIRLFLFLAEYQYERSLELHRKSLSLELALGELGCRLFVGEHVIMAVTLDVMLRNSSDAGATMLQISATENDQYLILRLADDGEGLCEPVKNKILTEVTTDKPSGTGLSLLKVAWNIQKIGGEIAYAGTGLDGKGASFEISLLKEMPEQK